MNRCPKCGKMFEGNFCPECGRSLTGERLCPNCKKKVPATAKFCAECGFTLTPQVQPNVKKIRPLDWIKEHKKLVIVMAIALVLVLVLSIAIPVAVHNRHNGTYYLYENEQYNYEKYFILKGDKYTDESGYSCDVKFDGDNITLYDDLLGIKDEFARGTIKDGVLKLNILGAVVTYAKDGHQHTLEEEIIKEATCEEEGSSFSSCFCGFGAGKTNIIPALGHDFGKDHLCKRCGMGNGALLDFTLNEEKTAYIVKGIGECKDSVIIIPNKHKGLPVTSIRPDAFYGRSGLASIDIPDSVTSIGGGAFYYCRGLTSVTIGSGVTSIGDYAFFGCSKLNEVHISDLAAWCDITFGRYEPSNPLRCAHHLFMNGVEIKDLKIPNGVTSIGDEAFSYCSGLTSVTIGSGVSSIGNGAFKYCSGLTSVTIGSSVTSIGEYAFFDCDGLTSIDIPDSVTSIGSEAFSNCSGLTSVTIGSGVTSIGDRAFYDCNKLKEVHFENPNGWKVSTYNDMRNAKGILGLNNSTLAADYLTLFRYYVDYYWKRG